MKAHFEMMAAYNGWANARLFAAAGELAPEDLAADLGAAFRSVLGTLNHIMVADLIWLARFRAQKGPPFGLDHILHDDIGELAAARRVLDADICHFVDGLDETALAAAFTYTTVTDGRTVTQPIAPALAHVFNHHAHHRGQAHALVTRLTGHAPSLDLIFFRREAA